MKKILAIVTMAAMVAGAFAVEFSSGTKINGTLFGLDENGAMTLLKEANGSADYANPNFVFNANGDNAGATLKLTANKDNGDTFAQTTQTIWFKPIDALKVTLGNFDIALNKEQIDWTESITGLGGNGYLLSVNASGFGLDAGFEANGKNWLTKAKTGDAAIDQFFVKAGFSADFGNIGAFLEMNRIAKKWTYHDAFVTDGTNAFDQKTSGSVKNMMFGAGYANNFSGINMFVNVIGYMGNKFDWVRPEVYFAGNFSGFGVSLFAAPIIFTNADLNKKTECEIVAKFTYGIDAVTAYLYFKDNNILAKTFASTIKIGAQGNASVIGWNTWLQIDTGKANNKVAITVPVEFSVNF